MAATKRERQLARERYLRQQARRAMMATQRRKRRQILAAALAVVAVITAVVLVARATGGSEGTATTAAATSAASDPAADPTTPPPPGTCTYTSTGDASKDVGVPPQTVDGAEPYVATLATNLGTIQFEALVGEAPCTTRSFAFLANKKYFDGTTCHRLTKGGLSVLQCGDPTGQGTGGPGYAFDLENPPQDGKYPAGTVAMARTNDPASNGSQFFLVYQDSELPAPGYSVFGRITTGLDAITKLAATATANDGAPPKPVRIESVTTTSKS